MNAITIILLLFALPLAAAADECFCLVNKDDHLRHSCEMQQQGIRQVFIVWTIRESRTLSPT